jgi:hypothetical protein
VIVRNHFHANLNAGGALRNLGKLVLFDVLVESNVGRAIVTGGFSSNNVFANGSLLAISLSTLRNNRGETGAAILTLGGGPSFVVSSTVTDNQADVGSVGAAVFAESGEIRFVNTTIARNQATGVVTTGGSLRFVGCTIADNAAPVGTDGGGILNLGGLTDVLIQNTILARNTVVSGGNAVPRDCAGNVGSNGNNLVGTFAGCSIILRPIDKLGDPGLGVLTDQRPSASGAAFGLGHLPLLAGSQAIDAGEPAACSPNDQLGFPRADGDLNGAPRATSERSSSSPSSTPSSRSRRARRFSPGERAMPTGRNGDADGAVPEHERAEHPPARLRREGDQRRCIAGERRSSLARRGGREADAERRRKPDLAAGPDDHREIRDGIAGSADSHLSRGPLRLSAVALEGFLA